MTAPAGTSRKLIDLFVGSRADWIAEKLALFNSVEAPSSEVIPERGAALWVLGRRLTLDVTSTEGDPVVNGSSILTCRKNLSCGKLRSWLDSRLIAVITPMIEKYSAVLGVSPTRIRLGNARARWGSCSSKGVIMVNRKLIHAPLSVIDYIAAHETVHLVHRNHSFGFHEELRRLNTKETSARKWLRLQGAHLLQ